uniref:Protein disulfide-isomerase n=1 Tax=Xenopsylla cheopis TaxID=163159 RepID=A0A6M2DV45_XENCH
MLVIKTLFILSAVSFCFAGEEHVHELTDDDFTARLGELETALVMFYAPWCGHCKRLKPEFAKAAETLQGDETPIALAKVDCTEGGKETCGKFSVSGYPTLKIFRNGELSQDYNGPREAGGIVKYMRAQVGPSSKDITSLSQLEAFLKPNEVAVVGFFKKETDLKGEFLKLADKMREKVRFAHTSSKDVLAKYEASDDIILFRAPHLKNKFEDSFVKFDGKATKEALTSFIQKNYHGLVGHRTRDNMQEFNKPLVVAYYDVDYVKNAKGTNYWRNRVLKVAKEQTKVNFAVSSKADFQHELNEYGIDHVKDDKPVVLARNAKGQKYIMQKEFSVEAIQEFIDDMLAGNLEAYMKSEPIPESNDAPVKVAVAKNFDEIVTNNEQDTLIEFYAPWCGHCKKLAPVYDELGEKLKDEDVAIVKFDASNNDVPSVYDVTGFPTLYWAPKDSKDSPVRYDGGRELDDFIKYIAKHSTEELKSYDRSGKPRKTEL